MKFPAAQQPGSLRFQSKPVKSVLCLWARRRCGAGRKDGSVFSLVLPLPAPGFDLTLPSAAQGPRPACGRDWLSPGCKVSGDASIRRGWRWPEDGPGSGPAVPRRPRTSGLQLSGGGPTTGWGRTGGLCLVQIEHVGEAGLDWIPRPFL